MIFIIIQINGVRESLISINRFLIYYRYLMDELRADIS
jgi:hypothetical protein